MRWGWREMHKRCEQSVWLPEWEKMEKGGWPQHAEFGQHRGPHLRIQEDLQLHWGGGYLIGYMTKSFLANIQLLNKKKAYHQVNTKYFHTMNIIIDYFLPFVCLACYSLKQICIVYHFSSSPHAQSRNQIIWLISTNFCWKSNLLASGYNPISCSTNNGIPLCLRCLHSLGIYGHLFCILFGFQKELCEGSRHILDQKCQ